MEKSSDDKKKLKSIVSRLQKSVECPVCLETVKHPFKACVRGHSVCLDCVKKLEKCPLCKELFTLENLVCLTSVLDALPRFCIYSDAGCEEVVEPGNDHEMFCGFRPIVCKEKNCSVKMPLIKYLDHHKSQHPTAYIFNKIHSLVRQPGYLILTSILYTPVSLFNNLFWICEVCYVPEKQFNIYFLATPIGKLEHDYYVRVEFRKEEFAYAYTLKAQVISCEEIFAVKDDKLDKKYCMKIPREEMHNFLNQNGDLEYSYNFFEKKVS